MSVDLADLLVRHRAYLAGLVEREGSGLLRYEQQDDLVQGVVLRALSRRADFEYSGELAFRGWLTTIARRFFADRNDHWSALRRGSGRVMRLTTASGADAWAQFAPPNTGAGPSSFAARREQLALVTRALDILPDRDRRLVTWQADGLSIAEQAERLGMNAEAVRKAAQRALERFKKAFRLVARSRPT